MNIIFDNIIFSQQRVGGISVVWYELLKRVIAEKSIIPFFVEYKKGKENLFRKLLDIHASTIIKKTQFCLKLMRYFNPVVDSDKKFIFHSSYYRTSFNKMAINITTVHDFTYEKYYSGISRWLHCKQKYNAIRNSDYIVCISENTKKDLLIYLPSINEDKIRVIYNGVSDEYFKLLYSSNNKLIYNPLSYVLFVGSRQAYKRFNLVIDVLKNLNYKLVIVGGGELTKNEKESLNINIGVNNYVHFKSINNEELNIYYNSAFCLIYPSEYEGFGIPVIEAQKAGCPVIAYNGSSIKEIAGETPLLFNNHSVEEITGCLNYLKDEENRVDIINKGLLNASFFCWDNTFFKYLDLYKEANTKY